MNAPYFMAIDGGTGSLRAVIFDKDGTEICSSSTDWTHLAEADVLGSMFFDITNNFDRLIYVIKSVLDKLEEHQVDRREVVSLAASSMREGIVLLDEHGEELWACANVDSRSNKQVKELMSREGLAENIYHKTGQTFSLSAQPRLLWLSQNRPELYERTHKILMISEWILYKLSGVLSIEPTNGSTSGLINLKTRDADDTLLSDCGLKTGLIPEVREPGTVIGTLLPEIAEITGLNPSLKVVLAGGDAQMAAVGAGLDEASLGLVVGGTFWQQEVNIPAPKTDPQMRVRINAAATSDMWQAEAIAFHVGTAMRWFRDTVVEPETNYAKEQGIDPFAYLDSLAKEVEPGSLGIIPIFSDSMNYRNWRHAAPSFLNIPIDKSGQKVRIAMYRSLLENAAYLTKINLELVESFARVELSHIVFAGGGSKSPLWSQILADVLGKKVVVPKVKETTALGTALQAAVGAGFFSSIKEGSKTWVGVDHEYSPNEKSSQIHDERIIDWQIAYKKQLELSDLGTTNYMWKAPGI